MVKERGSTQKQPRAPSQTTPAAVRSDRKYISEWSQLRIDLSIRLSCFSGDVLLPMTNHMSSAGVEDPGKTAWSIQINHMAVSCRPKGVQQTAVNIVPQTAALGKTPCAYEQMYISAWRPSPSPLA